MASSFNDALQAASLEADTSVASVENNIMTLSLEPDDGFEKINNPLYMWISDYTDIDYSTIDALKNIHVSNNQINISQEENSQVIPFELQRYYDGIDLAQMTFQIHYVNSEKNDGLSTPINVMCNSDKIRFYWLVDGSATSVSGILKFEIIASGTVSTPNGAKKYVWKTRPSTSGINILESLSGNGAIEPSEGWDTYLQQVSNLVGEAQSYCESARQSATQAQESANTVDTKISKVSSEITEQVKADLVETLAQYYTKEEVDEIIANMDFTDILNEVQNKIDAIDGLSSFNSTYDESTGIITFYNGETIMTQHTLATNPTEEWTAAFKSSLKTDIDDSVKVVSDALDAYKTENNGKVSGIESDISGLKTDLQDNYYSSADVDKKLDEKADDSDVSTLQTSIDQVKSTADTNKSNVALVTTKLSEIEERINGINTDPSLSYYATYDAETGLYTLYEVENDVEK